jgi:hypothetical protein
LTIGLINIVVVEYIDITLAIYGGITMINEQRLLDEFLELVQTDSETGHERKICDLLKAKLTELGFDVISLPHYQATSLQNLLFSLLLIWIPLRLE